MTPSRISLSSFGSFFLWWLARSGALPLEHRNAPNRDIKKTKKAYAQAKDTFPPLFVTPFAQRDNSPPSFVTPSRISLSSFGSFFLWWLSRSGALPLEHSNAPNRDIKKTKKAYAQAKDTFPPLFVTPFAMRDNSPPLFVTPSRISLSSLGSFFLWWLAKSRAFPLELMNAPTLVIKEAKKARAQAKTRFPYAHFARALQEFVACLARTLQSRRLSCKILAYSTAILQESYKIHAYLARFLHIRRLSCKILQESCKILQDVA